MPERPQFNALEIGQIGPHRGLVVKRVGEEEKPSGEPLLVVSVYVSGFVGDPNSYRYLNVVTLTAEKGVLAYKCDPQKIRRGEKVVVLTDLQKLGWDFTQKFYELLNEDDRKEPKKRVYTLRHDYVKDR